MKSPAPTFLALLFGSLFGFVLGHNPRGTLAVITALEKSASKRAENVSKGQGARARKNLIVWGLPLAQVTGLLGVWIAAVYSAGLVAFACALIACLASGALACHEVRKEGNAKKTEADK